MPDCEPTDDNDVKAVFLLAVLRDKKHLSPSVKPIEKGGVLSTPLKVVESWISTFGSLTSFSV